MKKVNTSRHYIDNKVFLAVMIEYRDKVQSSKELGVEKPRVPEYIGECSIKIANQLAFKSNFINYSYRDDMILDAIENCLTYIDNFDPAKSSNPFAYFTQITYYAFLRRIQKEKKHLKTKHKMIENFDIDSIITQEHDNIEYMNSFISYLQKYAENGEELEEKLNVYKRKPKYMMNKETESEDPTTEEDPTPI